MRPGDGGGGDGDHPAAARLEVAPDLDFHAHRAVDRPAAERARQARLLLGRLELDHAGDPAYAAVAHQLERVHRPEGLAQLENALGERVKIARLRGVLEELPGHPGDASSAT